ncbi:SDR family NAD(P)-dependent oxidoreductase [Terriglobus aquaticus]|uniref:SDR family NAD(P)-dependent oxidoreductase n=1 Tax=Terriglobus aquaticus TaxID=940139 RepID=A0ABW9KMG5_9BACT|nr:SDR family oxidoreductase [Terriglobus aquaticus]
MAQIEPGTGNIGAGVELSLQDKCALITGGSRGIGAATLRLFRRAGARVAFSYRAAAQQAETLATECGGAGVCHAIQQDLLTPADGEALIAASVAALGRLDCLVINHGIWPSHDAPIGSMADEQWRETLGTNLDSVFGLLRAGVAQMQRQPVHAEGTRGKIVLVSSTAGQRGEAFHTDYAASKGALISMTKGLSTELAAQGIAVNCVAPGWVHTDMSAETLADPLASKKIGSTIPLGRVGTPDEIAGPILFLCTPWAGFVQGEIFNVNGGAVLVG